MVAFQLSKGTYSLWNFCRSVEALFSILIIIMYLKTNTQLARHYYNTCINCSTSHVKETRNYYSSSVNGSCIRTYSPWTTSAPPESAIMLLRLWVNGICSKRETPLRQDSVFLFPFRFSSTHNCNQTTLYYRWKTVYSWMNASKCTSHMQWINFKGF